MPLLVYTHSLHRTATSWRPAMTRAPTYLLDTMPTTFWVNLTSSSILASAISCSLPDPDDTFCASEICDLTASSLNSSIGNPSVAFMLSTESGWTMANPPETVLRISPCVEICLGIPYERIACCHPALQLSRSSPASVAQSKGHAVREYPSLQTQRVR